MENNMEMFDTTAARIAVLENEVKNIATDVKEMRGEQKSQHEMLMKKMSDMDNRLAVVERWRWMLLGASVVAGYIIAHISPGKFF
jgi:hypothetical protein